MTKSELARHQTELVMKRLSSEEKNLRLEMEDLKMELISTTNAKVKFCVFSFQFILLFSVLNNQII